MDTDALFQKGSAAADRGNYDYAIAIYRELLANDPGHIKAKIALRGCERRRFDESGNQALATILGYLKGFVPLIKTLLLKKDPEKLIGYCEDLLLHCPRSVGALIGEAEAARRVGRSELAIYLYEDVRQLRNGYIKALRALGELYEEKDDGRKALNYYQEALRYRPGDGVIDKKIRDLQAVVHMQESKIEDAESFTDSIKDADEAREARERTSMMRSEDAVGREIAELTEEIKQNPKDVRLLSKLGDLYAENKNAEMALKAFRQACRVDPRNFDARAKFGNLQLRRADGFIGDLQTKLRANPDDQELKKKLEDAQTKRKAFAMQEYVKRVEMHPTDMGLRLEYGVVLMDSQEIDRAIGEFQQAVNDNRQRMKARQLLGECFVQKKQHDLAIRQFEEALKDSPVMTEQVKGVWYSLGRAYEEKGDRQKAADIFQKIYEVDIQFEDVAKRVEELGAQA